MNALDLCNVCDAAPAVTDSGYCAECAPALPTVTVYAEWLDRNFEAHSLGPTWNGWATPIFTRRQAEILVAAHAPDDLAWGLTTLRWDGDEIIAEDPAADEPVRIGPDERGLYDIDLGWVWQEADALYGPDEEETS